jgi:hypothetical protein
MIPPMKSLWMLCVLAGGLALGTGCGPQEEFCPTSGSNMGGKCPIIGDDARNNVIDGGPGSLCPTGEHIEPNPDGNIVGICVRN